MDKLSAGFGERRLFYLLNLLLVAAGLSFGVLACMVLGDEKLARLNEFYRLGLSELGDSARFDLLHTALSANLLDVVKVAFLGLCLLGIPLLAVILFAKGFSVGFTAAFVMTKTGAGGFWNAMIGVAVPKAVYLPILIMAASYAMSGSFQLWKHNYFDLSRFLLRYLFLMAAMALLMVLAALVEGAVTWAGMTL